MRNPWRPPPDRLCARFFEFVQGFLGEAWGSLVSWWNDTAFEDGKFTIGGLLNGIWEAVKDIGAWIKEHIFDPFVNGFKDVFGIDPASTVMEEMGGGVMDGLFNGINDAIAPIVELFEGIFNGFTSFVEDVFTVDWKAAWKEPQTFLRRYGTASCQRWRARST